MAQGNDIELGEGAGKEKEQDIEELEEIETGNVTPPEIEIQGELTPEEGMQDPPPPVERVRKPHSKRVWPKRGGELPARSAKGVAKIQLSQLFGKN